MILFLLCLLFSSPLLAQTQIEVGGRSKGAHSHHLKDQDGNTQVHVEVKPDGSFEPSIEWNKNNSAKDIDPQVRALDYKKAFDLLRTENPDADTYLIVGGVSIHYVESFEPMPNGTLVHLKIRRSKKTLESKIIRVEDITELGQR